MNSADLYSFKNDWWLKGFKKKEVEEEKQPWNKFKPIPTSCGGSLKLSCVHFSSFQQLMLKEDVKGRISSCVAVIRRGHRDNCQNKIVWNNVQLLCYCGFEWVIHLEVPLQPVSHFSSDPLFVCGGEICKVPRNDPCPATRLLFLFWPFLINSTSLLQVSCS